MVMAELSAATFASCERQLARPGTAGVKPRSCERRAVNAKVPTDLPDSILLALVQDYPNKTAACHVHPAKT